MATEIDAAREAGERLADCYRSIFYTSMRDVPICNLRLEVEAVGFRHFGDSALGIIITPWFMNLTVCALDDAQAPQAQLGATIQRSLPAGRVDFIVGRIDGVGPVDSCSLFSPMDDFIDHDAARATAQAALSALFDPPQLEEHTPAADKKDPSRTSTLDRRTLLFGDGRASGTRGAP